MGLILQCVRSSGRAAVNAFLSPAVNLFESGATRTQQMMVGEDVKRALGGDAEDLDSCPSPASEGAKRQIVPFAR